MYTREKVGKKKINPSSSQFLERERERGKGKVVLSHLLSLIHGGGEAFCCDALKWDFTFERELFFKKKGPFSGGAGCIVH